MWSRALQKFEIFRDFDWPLFVSSLGLTLIGCLMLASAQNGLSYPVLTRQLVWMTLGVGALLLVVRMGYRSFLDLAYVLYGASVVLLILVMWVGPVRHGAQRWISIGPFALQPSEFAKLATILVLANYLGSKSGAVFGIRNAMFVFPLVMIPLFLILEQPDLGSAVIFLPVFFCMLFLSGVSLKGLFGIAGLGFASLPLLWNFLKEYQKRRLLVFLNPNIDPLGSGYTAMQAKITVGSGELFGRGFMQGTQTKLRFLPEYHTDFVFCLLAEEWGWLGGVLLLLLFGALLAYAFRVMEKTTDARARLVAGGVIAALSFHIVVNIGMTVGVMPVVGIPLPFISYGGSSLLSFMVGIGLLISIHKERSIF